MRLPVLIRITTVPISLKKLLTGQPSFMASNGFEVIMMSADGKEGPEVEKAEGCKWMVVPMTRQITPFMDLYCLAILIQHFRRLKPAIVHTHTPKAGLLGMLAAKIAGVPVRLHTVAGLPLMVEKGLKLKILIATEKLTYWGAQKVWPNSQSLTGYIREKKLCPERKLGMIREGSSNGVDTEEYNRNAIEPDKLNQVKQTVGYQPENYYLIAVGRVVKDKGIEELVACFEELKKDHPALRLILLGPLEAELDPLSPETLHAIQNDDRIVHIHYSDDVKYYLALAHLLIHASHREGFPNVLLQAGAMKTPVVCSDIVGNIDIVEDQKTGLLFRVGDPADMKMRVEYALKNRREMERMSDNLLDKINAHFSRASIQSGLLEAYQKELFAGLKKLPVI